LQVSKFNKFNKYSVEAPVRRLDVPIMARTDTC